MDYKKEYDEYWLRSDRWGSHSFDDPNALAKQIEHTCGRGSVLDVGCGMGLLVRTLVGRGIDAIGTDIALRVVEDGNQQMPGRFHAGSILSLPFPDGAFEIVCSTDCLEHLAEADVPQALHELYRVCRRFAFIRLATTLDRDGRWHLTIKDRAWWETKFFEAGFRKHPLCQQVTPFETSDVEGRQITLLVEKIPAVALMQYPLDALKAERDLHMDMLREPGIRSDAHLARYTLARAHLKPGMVVLDAACGLGYGSAMMVAGTGVAQVIGMDLNEWVVEYARANYGHGLPQLEFHAGDATKLGFLADASVDAVVSFETLEHLPNPDRLLQEFSRVLKPGGLFIGSVPNLWIDEQGRNPVPYHLHIYDHAQLREQVAKYFEWQALYRQNAGGGWKRPQGRLLRLIERGNPTNADLQDAEWWIGVANKPVAKADPVQTEGSACLTSETTPGHSGQDESLLPHTTINPTTRIVVLDEEQRHQEIYGRVFEELGIRPESGGEQSAEQILASKPDAILLSREWSRPWRLTAAAARRANVPVIYVMDGVIEWSYVWNNLSFVKPEGTVLQPLLASHLCVVGRHPARILAGLGLADRIHVVGLPRLDSFSRTRTITSGQKPRILIATAKTFAHNVEHKTLVRRALRDLKNWFEANPFVLPVWRIAEDVADEIGVHPQRVGTFDEALAEASGTISFSSTCLIESMLKGLPTAQLDYRTVPLYVQAAWEIRCAEQIPGVIQELLYPPPEKMAFQEQCLEDELEPGNASERLAQVICQAITEARNPVCQRPSPAAEFGRLDFHQVHSQLSAFSASLHSPLQYELDALQNLYDRVRQELRVARQEINPLQNPNQHCGVLEADKDLPAPELPPGRNVMEVFRVADRKTFSRLWDTRLNRIIEAQSALSPGGTDPLTLSGVCAVCGGVSTFTTDFMFASPDATGRVLPCWRERQICSCRLNCRQRSCFQFLTDSLGLVQTSQIYCTEQQTNFYQHIRRVFPRAIGSEYCRDLFPLGSVNQNGVRNEDVTRLTFPDQSFDCVLSLDVMQRVPDYRAGFREMARCLKPGGKLLLTVPFHFGEDSHVVRASVNPDGSITRHLPPVYHGDPVNPKGALCFTDFGWDIVGDMRAAGFGDATVFVFTAPQFGYVGLQYIVLATRCPAKAGTRNNFRWPQALAPIAQTASPSAPPPAPLVCRDAEPIASEAMLKAQTENAMAEAESRERAPVGDGSAKPPTKMVVGLILATRLDAGYSHSFGPLGLGYLAASVRKQLPGVKVVMKEELEDLLAIKPDLIGISAQSENYAIAVQFAKRIKAELNIPVVIGGVHITMLPESLNDAFDVAVIGEGEITFVELLQSIIDHAGIQEEALKSIPGLYFKDGGRFHRTARRELVTDLDLLAPPILEELPFSQKSDMVCLVSARGCPYHCTFCISEKFSQRYRSLSFNRVADDIEDLVKMKGVKHIVFFDDLLIAQKKRVQGLISSLREKGILGKCAFSCAVRANLIDEEMCSLLKELGVKDLGMGVESFSDKILKYYNKTGCSGEINQHAIDLLHAAGIKINPSIIFAAPIETKEDMLITLRKVFENLRDGKINSPTWATLIPYPGTKIWDYALQRRIVGVDMDWNNFSKARTTMYLCEEVSQPEFHELMMEWLTKISILLQDHPEQGGSFVIRNKQEVNRNIERLRPAILGRKSRELGDDLILQYDGTAVACAPEDALRRAADALYGNRLWNEAEARYKALAKRFPEDLLFCQRHLKCLQNQGFRVLADLLLEESLKRHPEWAAALNATMKEQAPIC